jgi:4-aminobutyrate aminotransferase-like enzyme
MKDFLWTYLSVQCSIAAHPPYLSLIKKMKPHLPHASLDSFFFTNSGTISFAGRKILRIYGCSTGSEAVETAIKISRIATRKQNIISMQGNYFGCFCFPSVWLKDVQEHITAEHSVQWLLHQARLDTPQEQCP